MQTSDVLGGGLWSKASAWCNDRSIEVPNKACICQALAELAGSGTKIIADEYVDLLKEADRWAIGQFNVVR